MCNLPDPGEDICRFSFQVIDGTCVLRPADAPQDEHLMLTLKLWSLRRSQAGKHWDRNQWRFREKQTQAVFSPEGQHRKLCCGGVNYLYNSD